MNGFGLIFNNGVPEMTYARSDTTVQNIWLSVFIKKGSFFAAPNLGSRLYMVKKVTDESLKLCKSYIEESIAWMVGAGRILNLEVSCERMDDPNRIKISISGNKQSGDEVTFETFYKVV